MGIHSRFELDETACFIYETGFNLHTQRNDGRSLKGAPAKGMIPTLRDKSITILGAISQASVIDVSLKKHMLYL